MELVFSTIIVSASIIMKASEISYKNKDSEVDNVQDAIDELIETQTNYEFIDNISYIAYEKTLSFDKTNNKDPKYIVII